MIQPPVKILIVDSNLNLAHRYYTKRVLQDAGYETYVAYNIADALTIFQESNPQLIISELFFEGARDEGLELEEKLREVEGENTTPIIYVTVVVDSDVIDKVTQLATRRPVGVLYKPISREKLLGTITKLLHLQQEREEIERDRAFLERPPTLPTRR